MDSVYFKPCALTQVSRRCSWRFYANSKSTSRFLCNRLDEPLKASGRPVMSRSFNVEDFRMSGQHHLDARSSFSNFYSELHFSRHYLGSLCKTSGWCGNSSGRYPAFQNILGFLYKREKELQRRPSRRGPVLGRIALFWKDGRRRPSDCGYLPSGCSIARVRIYLELGFLKPI